MRANAAEAFSRYRDLADAAEDHDCSRLSYCDQCATLASAHQKMVDAGYWYCEQCDGLCSPSAAACPACEVVS